MHRFYSLILTFFIATSISWGQTSVRYWFDQQSAKQTLTGSEIDCSTLTTGVHFAHFQIVDADGMLSPVRSQAFLVMNDRVLPSSDYSKISYWFDQHKNRKTLEGNEISTEGLSTGIHFVHLQIEGTDRTLSPVRSQAFLVINANMTPSSAYSGINYWFDQQKVRTAYTSGDIDCTELSNGIHAVHFQLIDANGKPCPVRTQFFVNLDFAAHQIYYWFDDASERNLLDVGASEISVEGLANGKHTLHAMLADAKGNVISPEQQTADFVIVCPDDEHVDANADGICDLCDELFYYTRSTTEGRYGTVCLPKGATAAHITGADIFSISGKRVDDSDNLRSIVLEKVDDMEAGKPYIFLASGSELKVIYSGEAVDEALADNGLVGSFEYCEVAEGLYLLSNNTLVKCGPGCSIAGNRAYINMADVPQYVEGSVTETKMVVIGLDDATGIGDIRVDGGEAIRHNVSGIRIPRGTKGIVIMNGKKVLNK